MEDTVLFRLRHGDEICNFTLSLCEYLRKINNANGGDYQQMVSSEPENGHVLPLKFSDTHDIPGTLDGKYLIFPTLRGEGSDLVPEIERGITVGTLDHKICGYSCEIVWEAPLPEDEEPLVPTYHPTS